MSLVEIGKEVNEVEGHEREAEDDTDPFLTSFALKNKKQELFSDKFYHFCSVFSADIPVMFKG